MSKNKDQVTVDAVQEYLRSQNRPYSVNDIVQNLHKEHGKAAVQKALDKLIKKDEVREKTYGKQKVFLISQVGMPEATSDELRQMDQQIEEKEKNVKELEVTCKALQNELKALGSSMSTEEARELVDTLTKENAELNLRYSELASNNIPVLSKEERDEIRKNRTKFCTEWRKRKRMCMEGFNLILEHWPDTKKSLLEQIGIDTDEDSDIKLPTNF